MHNNGLAGEGATYNGVKQGAGDLRVSKQMQRMAYIEKSFNMFIALFRLRYISPISR